MKRIALCSAVWKCNRVSPCSRMWPCGGVSKRWRILPLRVILSPVAACWQQAATDNKRLRNITVNQYHEDDASYEDEAPIEFITIVEGPTPEFTPSDAEWPWGLQEGPGNCVCAVCTLRTFDGEALVERCQTAWEEDRPVHLDYPDGEGGRQEADIVAVRMETSDEGDVLHLWVCL